jgi:hypothetical protein
MLIATTVSTDRELKQILSLQEENLQQNISEDELKSQGFVTMHHSPGVLKSMHDVAPAVIIKEDENVVAYALTMFCECRAMFPPLEPMFAKFDELEWKGKPLSAYRYYAMGQICVAKPYRGKGLVQMLYDKHKEVYGPGFDFILTEIATRNHRSLKAHENIGFKTIDIYSDVLDEWAVVLWDWNPRL